MTFVCAALDGCTWKQYRSRSAAHDSQPSCSRGMALGVKHTCYDRQGGGVWASLEQAGTCPPLALPDVDAPSPNQSLTLTSLPHLILTSINGHRGSLTQLPSSRLPSGHAAHHARQIASAALISPASPDSLLAADMLLRRNPKPPIAQHLH